MPVRGTTKLSPSTKESTIVAKLAIPFSELIVQVNKNTPTAFSKSGREPLCQKIRPYDPMTGIDLRANVCLDADYMINVKRDGSITIARGLQHNTIRLAVPISFDGQVGFSGDLAKKLSLNKKNFDGAITAIADLSLDIGQDWCPNINVSTDFNWRDKARIEIIGGVWIPIADQVSGSLRDALNKLTESIKSSISCERIRAEVSKVWNARSFFVSIPSSGNLHINVDPIDLGFSGLNVTDDRVEFVLRAKAKIEVATSPIADASKSLPPLERVPLDQGQITLFVPLRASYEPLVVSLSSAVKDKEFSADTSIGKATVKVNDVTIYPSQERLVAGISFKADLPRTFLDTSGQVFLSGVPTVDSTGQVISVKNMQFTRILDNDLWNMLSAIFETQIKREIERAAVLDLSKSIEQSKAAISTELSKVQTQSGVNIELNNQNIGIRQIVPADKELFVEAYYEATAVATVASNHDG